MGCAEKAEGQGVGGRGGKTRRLGPSHPRSGMRQGKKEGDSSRQRGPRLGEGVRRLPGERRALWEMKDNLGPGEAVLPSPEEFLCAGLVAGCPRNGDAEVAQRGPAGNRDPDWPKRVAA